MATDSRIGREFSLPAQSVLELGLIECDLKNAEKATQLLNKCMTDYTSYPNENFVHIRAYAALRELGAVGEAPEVDDQKSKKFGYSFGVCSHSEKEYLTTYDTNTTMSYQLLLGQLGAGHLLEIHLLGNLAYSGHLPVDESIGGAEQAFEELLRTNDGEAMITSVEHYCDRRRCEESEDICVSSNKTMHCKNVVINRTKWENPLSQKYYECAARLANGWSHLIICCFPPKILRLINFLGIYGNESKGWKNLDIAMNNYTGIFTKITKQTFAAYLWLDGHMFLGTPDIDKYQRTVVFQGKIDHGIELYKKVLDQQFESCKSIVQMELMWCYALKCDLNEAIKCGEKFRTECKISPGCATYWEAVFRYAKSVDDNDSVEQYKATLLLQSIPDIRIRRLGKSMTPEKVAVVRADKYFKFNEFLILPEVVTSSDYLDNYLMATDSRIGREFSLPAQSVLELGLIECDLKNDEKATQLLNKCMTDYTSYPNENFVHIRAYAALRGLGAVGEAPEVDDQKSKNY
ncbi:unnamed protein product [Medioppia subpectinata]|uniref:Uncharacterized protein n=1 Tax=Medioppia subpectinata TaxID=1979941 RepID=A0A7R9KLD0_9ACAR|nr:unnamed protein product [Medioppia subpectinata]CAG2105391.1 unnamed protein product [Medioppia subpectinata]